MTTASGRCSSAEIRQSPHQKKTKKNPHLCPSDDAARHCCLVVLTCPKVVVPPPIPTPTPTPTSPNPPQSAPTNHPNPPTPLVSIWGFAFLTSA